MTVRTFTFNPFLTNCYIAWDEQEAVVIDPSCQSATEIEQVIKAIEGTGRPMNRVLLTHAHIDHIFGCAALCRHFDAALLVHADDAPLLKEARTQAAMFGVELDDPPEPSRFLVPGEPLTVGAATWNVLHTPGHSPGSVAFHSPDEAFVLSGDVLFAGSIGRTDLWRGSLPTLMQSIFQQLVPLGEEVRVLSGHGPETTIGQELATNPFLTGSGY
jgi:glyoxylase-like metal-dependent hydrolase (beta-lactamase superfamily II)